MTIGIDPGMKLTFPLSDAPSINVIMRENFHSKKKRKDAIKWRIHEQGFKKFAGQVRLSVTRYTNRLLDWDNACGSIKFIMDAIVDLGIIEDDNPAIVTEFQPEQIRVRTNAEQRIEVLIEKTTI